MLKAEYDYELDIQVQREEAYEQGEEVGRQQGEVIGRQQGEAIGKQQANIDAIRNMLEFGVSKADILKKYTKAEYDAAIAETKEK